MNETFISHSSNDNDIVFPLISLFDNDEIWVDHRELSAGDNLIESIERGVDESRNFLVILSNASLNSKWVKYEISMAIQKHLDNNGYRLIVANIDNVNVPTRLKPFIYITCKEGSPEEKAQYIYEQLSIADKSSTGKRITHQFVNRSKEIGIISDSLNNPEIRFLMVSGFRGIGKQSLVKKAIERNYQDVQVEEITLTAGHQGAVLTLDLCSKANLELPPDGSSTATLQTYNIAAIESLLKKQTLIVFKNFEAILDDDGLPNEDFREILLYFDSDERTLMEDNTIVFISTRKVDLGFVQHKHWKPVRIDSLEDKHMATILKAEVEHSSTSLSFPLSEYNKLLPYLHGYPLAGRIAAGIIAHYGSLDFVTDSLSVLKKIQVDIATEIMSRIELDKTSATLLEVMSMSEMPFSPEGLSYALNISMDACLDAIDKLSGYNLISLSKNGVELHPIVTEYFQKRASSDISRQQTILSKMANYATKMLKETETASSSYVYWLSTACRLLTLSNRYQESRQLRADFIGIVRDSAFILFNKQEYDLALKYCDDYLCSYPKDVSILYIKARCASRLGNYDESRRILQGLLSKESKPYSLAKYYFGLGRLYEENKDRDPHSMDIAIDYYSKSISYNQHPGAIQSLSELLHKQERDTEALEIINLRIQDAPSDPFALSIHADILWSLGQKAEALDSIRSALLHQPNNTSFLFRAGTFSREVGQDEYAYSFFKKAVKKDSNFIDARLSLARVCIDLGRTQEAAEQVTFAKKKLTKEKKDICTTIEIQLAVAIKDFATAEALSKQLLNHNQDPVTLNVVAKAYREIALYEYEQGNHATALIKKQKAVNCIVSALDIDPQNPKLLDMKYRIESLPF